MSSPFDMESLFPARFQAWLKKWGWKLRLLLANLGLGWNLVQQENVKTTHGKNTKNELVFYAFISHAMFTLPYHDG
jgi:hypothetical protein